MATVTVPTDPRMQFSQMDLVLANTALGRPPMAGAMQIGPDRYVLGTEPTRPSGISPAVLAQAMKGRDES
jgi:hypothetical protein